MRRMTCDPAPAPSLILRRLSTYSTSLPWGEVLILGALLLVGGLA